MDEKKKSSTNQVSGKKASKLNYKQALLNNLAANDKYVRGRCTVIPLDYLPKKKSVKLHKIVIFLSKSDNKTFNEETSLMMEALKKAGVELLTLDRIFKSKVLVFRYTPNTLNIEEFNKMCDFKYRVYSYQTYRVIIYDILPEFKDDLNHIGKFMGKSFIKCSFSKFKGLGSGSAIFEFERWPERLTGDKIKIGGEIFNVEVISGALGDMENNIEESKQSNLEKTDEESNKGLNSVENRPNETNNEIMRI